MAGRIDVNENISMDKFFTIKDKLNLLVLDDNIATVRLITAVLESPFINIVPAYTLHEARQKIRESKVPWHTWIIDMDLGNKSSGLSIIEEFQYFQFIIVLSGVKNMKLAFEVTKKGAIQVFDKTSEIITTDLRDGIYRIAGLGYLLGGLRTDYLNIFLPLLDKIITSPRQWTEYAFIGLRHLENLSMLHTGLTPRNALLFYYYICCLLYTNFNECGELEFNVDAWELYTSPKSSSYLENVFTTSKIAIPSIYQRFCDHRTK